MQRPPISIGTAAHSHRPISGGIEVEVGGRVVVNDHAALTAFAERGLGFIQISEPPVARQPETGLLEAVLSGLAPTSPGLFLHYPGHAQVMPRLRAFIGHVKAALADGRLAALTLPD